MAHYSSTSEVTNQSPPFEDVYLFALDRPLVDTLAGSRLHNLKELRVPSGAIRVLFVFDPRRTAILLLGGDKTDRWREWYERAIPEAERLYADYLKETGQEG